MNKILNIRETRNCLICEGKNSQWNALFCYWCMTRKKTRKLSKRIIKRLKMRHGTIIKNCYVDVFVPLYRTDLKVGDRVNVYLSLEMKETATIIEVDKHHCDEVNYYRIMPDGFEGKTNGTGYWIGQNKIRRLKNQK